MTKNIEAARIDAVIESIFTDEAARKAISETSKLCRAFRAAIERISQKNPSFSTVKGAVQVVDFKNRTMMVETDHCGRIQLLQLHQSQIKQAINSELGCEFVKSILFRLKGQNYEIRPQSACAQEKTALACDIDDAETAKKLAALKEKFKKK